MTLNWPSLIGWLYTLTVLGISVFGLHMAILLLLAWLSRRPGADPMRPVVDRDSTLPRVLVQIPLYNERNVVERVIAATTMLDYPRDRLQIQILDDSTDETSQLAQALVERWAAAGMSIVYLHRRERVGFKAGALSAGLLLASEAEYVVIFDADFVPAPDVLRRWLVAFADQPRLGLVQGRWEHLNGEANWVAQAQALMFDSYFTVDQVARSAGGLLMNFNGSAGMWRRACIDEAGGWQGDTLAEDLDLSYRAQLKGWRLAYRPEIAAPAELPTSLVAFRQQQFRWAQGSFQVFRKLGAALIRAPLGAHRKLLGVLHILGYLPHVLLVLSLGLSLPLVALGGAAPLHWSALSWLAAVPFVVAAWGQWALAPARGEPRWRALGRLWLFPFLTLIFLGLAWSTTVAFLGALTGRSRVFERTPKQGDGAAAYSVRTDRFHGEVALAIYAAFAGWMALQRVPELAPVLFLYATSFGLTVVLGLREQRGTGRQSRAESAS